MLSLRLDLKAGGTVLLQEVSKFVSDYTASYPESEHFSLRDLNHHIVQIRNTEIEIIKGCIIMESIIEMELNMFAT
jgi:hypothetical protein